MSLVALNIGHDLRHAVARGNKMKKIAVCGKGGCGKSAVVALMTHGLRKRNYRVLVVDSDESNPSLYRMLGFDRPAKPLMELIRGTESGEKEIAAMLLSIGPNARTKVMGQKQISASDIPPQYIPEMDGIRLVSIGKIVQSLEGCACALAALTKEFLEKLHLEARDVLIADMEAGVEHFGRGVETSLDSVLVVIDPSYESLMIAEKVKSLTAEIDIGEVWAVLNKVPSDELASRLRRELDKKDIPVAGCIRFDPAIFEAGLEGCQICGGIAAEDIEEVLDSLLF